MKKIFVLVALLASTAIGCLGVPQKSNPNPSACDAGKKRYSPGCGDNNNFKAGCYAACDEKNPCPSGELCKQVSVEPACASPSTPGGPVCGACGQGVSLCMAATNPPPTTCKDGQEHHSPGCGAEIKFAEGCYTPCGADKDCGANEACKLVTVLPSCAKSKGDIRCAACGRGIKLCLAKSP